MKEGVRSNVNGVGVDGKGKRGRKRKRVINKKEKNDDGVISNDVNNGDDLVTVAGEGSGQIENLAISSSEVEVKEVTECENGSNVDVEKATVVASKGKRGRKRKNVELSECKEGDGKKSEKGVLDVMTQVNGRVLRSRTMASANGGNTEETDDMKKADVENDEDKIVPPTRKAKAKKKGRRGRPPKVNLEKGVVEMAKSKKKLGKKRNKLRSIVPEACQNDVTESKEDKGTVRKEKQLIRLQIMEMIIKAGWAIDYRPRNGSREYNDAVYVEPDGRTHWSITKAYKKLKEKVDEGDADAQEIAAFDVIPDEVLGKLCKVMEKKRNDFGKKKGRGVTIKKVLKNKSSSKKNLDSKGKEKSNLRPKSHGRKQRSSPEEGRKKKRYALLARGSENGSNQAGDGFVVYNGKRSLFSWMIDMGIVPQSGKVQYMIPTRKKPMLDGKITGDGIRCSCCSHIHSAASFESHAGSDLGNPFRYIYLKSGPSLLQCLIDSWFKHEKIDKIEFCSVDVAGDDPNDDTCNICGDGGDLICCDGCPSTFHQSCLAIQHFPSGDWRCVYCSCKFCGIVGGESSQDDENHGTFDAELFTCQLCEEKFHVPCIEGKDAAQMNSETPSYCGEGCQKIFKGMQQQLGINHKLDDGFSWTILQRCEVDNGALLRDDPTIVKCNSMLAVAFSVMDECFLPIIDERSRSNMIHNVVYSCGSNFKRLNYSGFYTVILQKEDEVIAAASIRIHGTQLAEMPFIATRYRYRRQGMCRRLLTAIERVLGSIGVEKLVIPAISELMETWTKVFGFVPLEESQRREMRFMSLIVFPKTDMLQKPLQKCRLTDEPETSSAGSEATKRGTENENEPSSEEKIVDELPNKYDIKCSSGSDSNASNEQMTSAAGSVAAEVRIQNESKVEDQTVDELSNEFASKCFSGSDSNPSAVVEIAKNEEADAAGGSGASLPDGSMNDASDITTEASKVKNDQHVRCLDLNEPANDKDMTAPELSVVDGPPPHEQQTNAEMEVCDNAEPGSVDGRIDEKIVECTPQLIQQSSQ